MGFFDFLTNTAKTAATDPEKAASDVGKSASNALVNFLGSLLKGIGDFLKPLIIPGLILAGVAMLLIPSLREKAGELLTHALDKGSELLGHGERGTGDKTSQDYDKEKADAAKQEQKSAQESKQESSTPEQPAFKPLSQQELQKKAEEIGYDPSQPPSVTLGANGEIIGGNGIMIDVDPSRQYLAVDIDAPSSPAATAAAGARSSGQQRAG